MYFVDLKKTCNCILWEGLWEYGFVWPVDVDLSVPYNRSESLVHTAGRKRARFPRSLLGDRVPLAQEKAGKQTLKLRRRDVCEVAETVSQSPARTDGHCAGEKDVRMS